MAGVHKYSEKQRERARRLHEQTGLTLTEIGLRMGIPRGTVQHWARESGWKRFIPEDPTVTDPTDPKTIEIERLESQVASLRLGISRQRSLHKSLSTRYEELRERMNLLEDVGPPVVRKIRKSDRSSSAEGTVLAVASDWHVEEEVKPEQVNGLNEFNRKICDRRVERFFNRIERLVRLFRQDIKIDTIVLALLGDFLTNQLHDENAENNSELPIDAIIIAQSYIASGISFLRQETGCKLILPCHTGNHGRTTKRIHVTTEYGHSLEYLMYKHLEKYFEDDEDVEFVIPRGHQSYLEIYDTTVRFHHGHLVRYQGGVGGIYIPVNKAIAQWNKGKHADLDVFGHFHQLRDGGNFICNGSLIGHSAFGLSIKADYERPKQALSLFDSRYGRTINAPILVD